MVSRPLISVVIRTYNEELHLSELLAGIHQQELDGFEMEVVVVDSGSSDRTLEIASHHACRITHIAKSEFTFGRSLNVGCEFAKGDYLVFISGHCVPATPRWLQALVEPLVSGICEYSYGRQLGRGTTKYSESRVFKKYFPDRSMLPQQGFFTNNANAAISRDAWLKHQFDETLTGLEDMHLAKNITDDRGHIGYVAEAAIYHIHDESWAQVKNRYEREAIALLAIMPEAAIGKVDLAVCYVRSVLKDTYAALKEGVLLENVYEILMFRACQYYGSYCGTRLARQAAKLKTKTYFYPDVHFEKPKRIDYDRNSSPSNEAPQQPSAREEF